MISVLQGLGHRVTATGVETADEFERLVELGCDGLQGFFLGAPAPADEVTKFLREMPTVRERTVRAERELTAEGGS
jgi:EAL domain-containing protein (putative c-di-GMP-specific phosphodiesterase class I)